MGETIKAGQIMGKAMRWWEWTCYKIAPTAMLLDTSVMIQVGASSLG